MQTVEQDRETDALDAFRLEDYLCLADPLGAFLGADLAEPEREDEAS